eukprot:TRINITY_DN6909_c0_g2_i4.p1 TRINITY_DN6909_c0_g2~~TRINITY_DN6909_c0_g2_i4.p1  ORF type:complete len:722 (+),score=199.25 TRINITY_DN6909_c0_g2_i4:69-2234(+)
MGAGGAASEHIYAAAVFSISLGVYLATAHPSCAGGDAGELATVAHGLGVAHPPGYPTMTLLTWAAENVYMAAGAESRGAAQNQFHALLSALANTALSYAAGRHAGVPEAGLVAAGVFGFAPIVWTYATHIEVFSLNNLILNALAAVLVTYAQCDRAAVGCEASRLRVVYLGAFLCGLALTNQHTSVLYVVPWAAWVFANEWRAWVRRPGRCGALGVAFAVGLLPYVYLPVSAAVNPNPNSWGAVASAQGFADHFFRKDYGTFSLASQHADYSKTSANWARAWRYYAADLQDQTLGYLAAAAGVAAVAALYRWTWGGGWRGRPVPVDVLLVGTLALYLNFFHYLCNLPIDQPLFYGVQQRFWIQPLAVTALLIGQGCVDAARWAAKLVPHMPVRGVVLAVAVAVTYVQCDRHYDAMDQSGNLAVRDFGRMILDPLPRDSIVLTKGDLMINSARYVQELEGVRPDVRLVDQELMTFPWYVATLKQVYPDITFPGDYYTPGTQGAFGIAQLFKANRKRRFFLAHGFKDGDHTWQGEYSARPYGIIHEVVTQKALNDLSPRSIQRYVKAVEGSIPPPSDIHLPSVAKYAPHTWERVVLNDYWQGRHNVAYAFLQFGQALHEKTPGDLSHTGVKYTVLSKARARFEELVAHNQPAGGSPHRNLGVVLQVLIGFHPEDVSLVAATRDAFQAYLKEAGDKVQGAGQIEDVVKQYTDYLEARRGGGRKM